MTATTAQQMPGFVLWISQYGSMIAFFVQVLWWLLTGVAAIWAAWNFQRYVETRMGTLKSESGLGESEARVAKASTAADKPADKTRDGSDTRVDVDKFVE